MLYIKELPDTVKKKNIHGENVYTILINIKLGFINLYFKNNYGITKTFHLAGVVVVFYFCIIHWQKNDHINI